jgi:hypothetical protein
MRPWRLLPISQVAREQCAVDNYFLNPAVNHLILDELSRSNWNLFNFDLSLSVSLSVSFFLIGAGRRRNRSNNGDDCRHQGRTGGHHCTATDFRFSASRDFWQVERSFEQLPQLQLIQTREHDMQGVRSIKLLFKSAR